ncbi:phage tail tube protein [Aneurinibacillus aneurinilyticus]|uniref:phage tail tube protein n=1 Tax=Aneurinibacillus aneurinilyticus TaxID=1391 RepID=UPI003526BCA8
MSIYDKDLPKLDPRTVPRGKYGHIYDEDGEFMDNVTSFEGDVDWDKAKVKRANATLAGHRQMGGEGKGKMKFYPTNFEFLKKLAMDPDATYTLIGELADPDKYAGRSNGRVIYKGVNFDKAAGIAFEVDQLIEKELPFTFDDWEWA